jgi:hypothetical protein
MYRLESPTDFIIAVLAGFVSTFASTKEAAKEWKPGTTPIEFVVLTKSKLQLQHVPAYGIKAQGQRLRSLEQDITHQNAAASSWGGALAFGRWLLGYFCCWA